MAELTQLASTAAQRHPPQNSGRATSSAATAPPHASRWFSLSAPRSSTSSPSSTRRTAPHKALAASKGRRRKPRTWRKWLCYFTTIALVSQVEFVTSWLPGYYLFKFVGVLYLVLPQFNGIETVYTKFVEPFLVQHEKTIDDVLEEGARGGRGEDDGAEREGDVGRGVDGENGLAADAAAPAAAPAAAEAKKDE